MKKPQHTTKKWHAKTGSHNNENTSHNDKTTSCCGEIYIYIYKV